MNHYLILWMLFVIQLLYSIYIRNSESLHVTLFEDFLVPWHINFTEVLNHDTDVDAMGKVACDHGRNRKVGVFSVEDQMMLV
jgi:hypothetical protein